jgi:excisionase family DNA binding protein
MTVKEAAARLGISPSLVYALCEQKKLGHHRIGQRGRRGKIIIMQVDIDRFLEATKVEAQEPSAPYTLPRVPKLKHIRLGPPKPKGRS